MNKEIETLTRWQDTTIEMLNKKLEAQDKIINTQALEIARLNNLKTATDEAQEIIIELQQAKDKLQNDYQEARDRIDEFKLTITTQQQMIDELISKIDKAIEYIEEHKQKGYRIPMSDDYEYWNELNEDEIKELLEILGGKENE